jgi:hypothetical protein
MTYCDESRLGGGYISNLTAKAAAAHLSHVPLPSFRFQRA